MKKITIMLLLMTGFVYAGFPDGRIGGPSANAISQAIQAGHRSPASYGTAIGDGSGDSWVNAINIDDGGALYKLSQTTADQSKYFILTKDIDFQGSEIEPITSFTGYFDGRGHTLRNFKITDQPNGKNGHSLFQANTGTIKNLTIESSSVICAVDATSYETKAYGAIICCENSYGATIENCHTVNCRLYVSHFGSSSAMVGMIAGANHGTVDSCTSSGVVTIRSAHASSTPYIGGITGYQTGGSGGGEVGSTIHCYSSATINIEDNDCVSSVLCAGGIFGKLINAGATNLITDCHYNGVVDIQYTYATSNFTYVGGIGGEIASGTVSDCSATGTVYVDSDAATRISVGGGIGAVTGSTGSITDSYSDCDIKVGYAKSTYAPWVGGFVGQHYGNIDDCYCKGSLYDLTAGSTALNFQVAGGFVGFANWGADADMDNCWCAMDAYTATDANVEGFGGSDPDADVTGCFWDSDTSGVSAANGTATAKTTAELIAAATYATYDFVPTGGRSWKMVDGYDYPELEWEE